MTSKDLIRFTLTETFCSKDSEEKSSNSSQSLFQYLEINALVCDGQFKWKKFFTGRQSTIKVELLG